MDEIIFPWLMEHIHACEEELKSHQDGTRRAAALDDTIREEVANDELDEAAIAKQQKNWDGILSTIEFLLESCREDDGVRKAILYVDWALIAVDAHRADWIVFLASHPSFAADVISTQHSEEWQLKQIMERAEAEIAALSPGDGWGEDLVSQDMRTVWTRAKIWFDRRLQKLAEIQW